MAEVQAEYVIFEGNKFKLPHGVVSWAANDNPRYPGLKIMLDGELALFIEEDEEADAIRVHVFGESEWGAVLLATDPPTHTAVLRSGLKE